MQPNYPIPFEHPTHYEMKYPLNKKELRFKKKKFLYAFICIALVVGIILDSDPRETTGPHEIPVVSVMPVEQQNVEIFGEYVGRIRAQQFVEYVPVWKVSWRTCYLKKALRQPQPGSFVIDQRQYRAKADKARAQLKKRRGTSPKGQTRLGPHQALVRTNAARPVDLDNAVAAYETVVAAVGMSQPILDQAEQRVGLHPSCVPPSPVTSARRHVDLGTFGWAAAANRCWLLSSRAIRYWWTSA